MPVTTDFLNSQYGVASRRVVLGLVSMWNDVLFFQSPWISPAILHKPSNTALRNRLYPSATAFLYATFELLCCLLFIFVGYPGWVAVVATQLYHTGSMTFGLRYIQRKLEHHTNQLPSKLQNPPQAAAKPKVNVKDTVLWFAPVTSAAMANAALLMLATDMPNEPRVFKSATLERGLGVLAVCLYLSIRIRDRWILRRSYENMAWEDLGLVTILPTSLNLLPIRFLFACLLTRLTGYSIPPLYIWSLNLSDAGKAKLLESLKDPKGLTFSLTLAGIGLSFLGQYTLTLCDRPASS